jgi:uncharacterized protein with von Willebrand factor type A (vWA) domain
VNTAQPTDRIIGFIHFLRGEGFTIGIQEILDALASLNSQALINKKQLKHILRSLTCHSYLEWQQYELLFGLYWHSKEIEDGTKDDKAKQGSQFTPAVNKVTGFSGSSHEAPDLVQDMSDQTSMGAGRQNTFSKADFRFLNDHKAMMEIERLAEQLALKLNKRLSHQHVIRPTGSNIDIRQTIRRNLSHGGHPKQIFYKNRVRKPIHLVILHDVSHSMTWNNPLLFRFARGLVRSFKSSEAFAFHTELFKVTDYYREPSIEKMRTQLEARNHLWMGGTCIAESLHEFNTQFAARTLTSKTVFIIISDGFDTNKPEQLVSELKSIQDNSKKIVWLNPMLGREGYNPDNGSMLDAQPYIDKHAAAHSLDSLKQAVNYIARECH